MTFDDGQQRTLLRIAAGVGAASLLGMTLLPWSRVAGVFADFGNDYASLQFDYLDEYFDYAPGRLQLAAVVATVACIVLALWSVGDRAKVVPLRWAAWLTVGFAIASEVWAWREDLGSYFDYVGLGGALGILLPIGIAFCAHQVSPGGGGGSEASNMKQCAWCAEPIQRAAVVCRYCGRDVEEVPEGRGDSGEVRIAVVIGALLIIAGVFFGLKPVYDVEVSLSSFGDRVECGSAWVPNDGGLTDFGMESCKATGLDSNRTLSFVLIGIGIVALVLGPRLTTTDSTGEATPSTAGLRQCPHCAELIQPMARVCRYCGRDVPAHEPEDARRSAVLVPCLEGRHANCAGASATPDSCACSCHAAVPT